MKTIVGYSIAVMSLAGMAVIYKRKAKAAASAQPHAFDDTKKTSIIEEQPNTGWQFCGFPFEREPESPAQVARRRAKEAEALEEELARQAREEQDRRAARDRQRQDTEQQDVIQRFTEWAALEDLRARANARKLQITRDDLQGICRDRSRDIGWER